MKLFLKDNRGYIIIYFLSLLITLSYIILLGSLDSSEFFYILVFNTFILFTFLGVRYYKNREIYNLLNKNLNDLNETVLNLGNSVLGEGISNILNQMNSLYISELVDKNKNHEEHLMFINQWVHQMKTPLSIIQLKMQEDEGELPIENIRDEVYKLNKGLNMAMYFARLDSFQKDFVIDKVSLYKLVMNKINEEKTIFIKNKMKPIVEIDKNIEIYSDLKWIKFILEQIIVNGIKYSKGLGKELIIKAEENFEYVTLMVIDKGIGINKKDIRRVFDPFFTGENGRKYGESTGMGLYIVKKVCDNLGHIISIDSTMGCGTTIIIKFKK
ncbi:sensor histidine kinase [Clostridium sp. DSM 100503]|uniref:sensor histidine kinase n=1 Tax=Clostridium sp. DSM 100503 TaxID=2963282 RepID=UPI00214A4948|nr:sensor histidine kinase [Clostridium sp. DSM 100503]MCR1950394.1 sensor histidine kinase [Clostridium sp. DSM 100503]